MLEISTHKGINKMQKENLLSPHTKVLLLCKILCMPQCTHPKCLCDVHICAHHAVYNVEAQS